MVPSVILDDLIIVQILNKKKTATTVCIFVTCLYTDASIKVALWSAIPGSGVPEQIRFFAPPPEVAWETEKDPVGFCLKIVPVFK